MTTPRTCDDCGAPIGRGDRYQAAWVNLSRLATADVIEAYAKLRYISDSLGRTTPPWDSVRESVKDQYRRAARLNAAEFFVVARALASPNGETNE